MKIGIVALTNAGGHHISYLEAVLQGYINAGHNVMLIVPEKYEELKSVDQHIINAELWGSSSFQKHRKWIKEVNRLAKQKSLECIHFHYADAFLRYFGYGLHKFRKQKVILTCHQIREGNNRLSSIARNVSLRIIAHMSNYIVVHTDYLAEHLNKNKISNVIHIEYPRFDIKSMGISCKANELLKKLSASNHVKLVSLGSLRADKGILYLVKALKEVNGKFDLIIAGMEDDYTANDLSEYIDTYKENTYMYLEFLSDEEFVAFAKASDIVVLPYTSTFEGASGPMVEGVYQNKIIIAPNHGGLGKTVVTNHLGYIFKTEDVSSLAETITEALRKKWVFDEKYQKYQNCINVEEFIAQYVKIVNELAGKDS